MTKAEQKAAAKANHVPGGFVLLTFVCLGAFIWWKAGGSGDTAPVASDTPKVETQADKDRDSGMTVVYAARETVKTMLKDPDSAKFSKQFAVKTANGGFVACGEVNAKNGFGGYTGQSIYIMQDDVVRLENRSNANDIRRRWNAICAKLPTVYSTP